MGCANLTTGDLLTRAVIVVDMINDFVYGKFGGERPQAAIPCVKRLLEHARENGIPVIYMKDAHGKSDPEIEVWGEHAMKGSEGSQIIEELKPVEGDYVLEKTQYSSFFGTALADLLESLEVDELIIAGVTTDICIRHTVADAFFRGFKTIIPRECVNTDSDEAQERALEEIGNLYKTRVVSIEELVD